MKKLTNLLSVLFTILVMVASCTPAETDISKTTINQSNNVTIMRLHEYNEMMKAQRPQTRVSGRTRFAASVDIIGAMIGMEKAGGIGASLGLISGGAGMIATVVGGGIIYGAASSYIAYRLCKGYGVRADDFYKYSLNDLNQNIKSDTMNFYNKYVHIPQKADIKLPPGFKFLQAIGYQHNKQILGTDYDNPTTQSVVIKNPLQPVDNWTPPTLSEKALIYNALNSSELKKIYDKHVENLKSSIIHNEFNVDQFLKENSISERVDKAIKEYLDLFQTYPDNVDEIIKITNDYIAIIEANNEFTDDEKAIIYAGLMVSIYSPQIWDGFE